MKSIYPDNSLYAFHHSLYQYHELHIDVDHIILTFSVLSLDQSNLKYQYTLS